MVEEDEVRERGTGEFGRWSMESEDELDGWELHDDDHTDD